MFHSLPENSRYGANNVSKVKFITYMLNLKFKYTVLIQASEERFKSVFDISTSENDPQNAPESHLQTCVYCEVKHQDLGSCGFSKFSKTIANSQTRFFGRCHNNKIKSTNGIFCFKCLKSIDPEIIVRHFALRDYQAITTEMFHINKNTKDRDFILNPDSVCNEENIEFNEDDHDDNDSIQSEKLTLANSPTLVEKARLKFLLRDFICLSFTFPLSQVLKDIIMVLYFFLSFENNIPDLFCISLNELDFLDHFLSWSSAWNNKFRNPDYFFSARLLRKAVWRKGASFIISEALEDERFSLKSFDDHYEDLLIRDRSLALSVIELEANDGSLLDYKTNVDWIYEVHDYFLRWFVRAAFKPGFDSMLNLNKRQIGNYDGVIYKQMKTKIQHTLAFPFDSNLSYFDIQDVINDKTEDGVINVQYFMRCIHYKILPSWIRFNLAKVDKKSTRLVDIQYESLIESLAFAFVNDNTDNTSERRVTFIAYLLPKKVFTPETSSMFKFFAEKEYICNVIIKRVHPIGATQNLCFINALLRVSKLSTESLLIASKNRSLTSGLHLDKDSLFRLWRKDITDTPAASFLDFIRSVNEL